MAVQEEARIFIVKLFLKFASASSFHTFIIHAEKNTIIGTIAARKM